MLILLTIRDQLFFINMLGYRLLGRVGVVLFQIIFFFFTLLGAYKITGFMQTKQYMRWLAMAITVSLTLCIYTNGNMCEEHCLPFLMFSTYGQYCYFKHMNEGHNIWWGFFYGITIAISILTRATNAVAIVCGIIVIVAILIKNRQYQSILKNAIALIMGVGILFIPFSIYFPSEWLKPPPLGGTF